MTASAFDRAGDDPEFLARFLAAYDGDAEPLDALRWLDRPDLPGPSGARGPLAGDQARRALYGAADGTGPQSRLLDAVERDRAATRHAVTEALRSLGSTASSPAPSRPGDGSVPPRRRHRAVFRGGALLVVGALLGVVVASTAGEPPARMRPAAGVTALTAQAVALGRVLSSAGRLTAEDYYRIHPEYLPTGWDGSATIVSYRALTGRAELRPSTTGLRRRHLLALVTCPPKDGTYRLEFFTRAPAGTWSAFGTVVLGVCGSLVPEQMAVAPQAAEVSLRLSVSGHLPYSAAVLEQ